MQFSVTCRHFLCFRTKFCPQKRVLRHLQRVLKQATDRLTHQLKGQCRMTDKTVCSTLITVYTLGISFFKFLKTKRY
jgi:hypothetical protein